MEEEDIIEAKHHLGQEHGCYLQGFDIVPDMKTLIRCCRTLRQDNHDLRLELERRKQGGTDGQEAE